MKDTKTDRELMAQEYDAVSNRLFLVQVIVLFVLLALFQFTGTSQSLAEGLSRRFGEEHWYVSNAVYTVVSVFGFIAFMTPFSFYSGHVLERHYELSNETLGEWMEDFVKSLGIDLILAPLFFSGIYALLRWIPDWWWLATATFYIVFAVVLSTIAPVLIMPLFYTFEPLKEGDLSQAVRDMMDEAGIAVIGVFKWELEGRTSIADATFTGFGKMRRIVLSDTLLSGYSQEEILAVLAHEVGHFKHRDSIRLMITGALLALLGFFIANVCMVKWTAYVGVEHIYDIAAAPLFIFCLAVFSLISMPVANLHSRRREYAADAYAAETTGSPDALVSAFEKLADQNLTNKEPAPWVEYLLHSHPSMARRIKRMKPQ